MGLGRVPETGKIFVSLSFDLMKLYRYVMPLEDGRCKVTLDWPRGLPTAYVCHPLRLLRARAVVRSLCAHCAASASGGRSLGPLSLGRPNFWHQKRPFWTIKCPYLTSNDGCPSLAHTKSASTATTPQLSSRKQHNV